jgi:outer membrane protein OmpA-like peptidoglycan-associated protein
MQIHVSSQFNDEGDYMYMIIRIFLSFLLHAFLSIYIHPYILAQEESDAKTSLPLWYGFGLQGMYVHHNTDGNLQCLNDPACPSFNSGSGFGFGPLLSIEWMKNNWGLLSTLSYNMANGNLETEDRRALTVNELGQIVPLVRNHSLTMQVHNITSNIALQMKTGDLRIYAGTNIGFLINPHWTASSSLISPSNITFPSGKRDTVFVNEQTIQNHNPIQFGSIVGIGYDITLKDKVKISPELTYTQPFSSMVSSSDWKQSSLALSVSIRWGKESKKDEEFKKDIFIDTIEVKRPEFIGKRIVKGSTLQSLEISETSSAIINTEIIKRTDTLIIGSPPPPPAKPPTVNLLAYATQDSESQQLKAISLQGQFVTEGFPILPLVFFKPHSSELAERYHQLESSEGFSSDSLEPNSILQHVDILNIIGERLSKNEKATINLSSMSDPITEKSDCDLALQRAQTVKKYLESIWLIDQSRITINPMGKNCMPESPTQSKTEAGFEENRRVEIYTDDDVILNPVVRTRYIQLTEYSPKSIQLNPEGSTNTGINTWQLHAEYGDNEILDTNGLGIAPIVDYSLEPNIATLMNSGEPSIFQASLTLQDRKGLSNTSVVEIPIDRDTTNYAVQRLSLMHFGVLKSTLNEAAKSSISKFISNLEDDATISIIGYSDNLGNPITNNRLSKSRAKTVSDFIRKIRPNSNIVQIDGVGSSKLPPGIPSHELPESRFLSRTVQIEIIRSWKNSE